MLSLFDWNDDPPIAPVVSKKQEDLLAATKWLLQARHEIDGICNSPCPKVLMLPILSVVPAVFQPSGESNMDIYR